MDLQANLVTVTPASDVELDLAAIPAAIRRAGFRPEGMELDARGTFTSSAGASAFLITGWTSPLPVRGPAPREPGERALHAHVEVEDGVAVLVLE